MTKRVAASSPRAAKVFTWRSNAKVERLDYGQVYAIIRDASPGAEQEFDTKQIQKLKAIQEIVK